jgi:hypothetical protein
MKMRVRAGALAVALLVAGLAPCVGHAFERSATPACGECIGDLCVGSSARTEAWLVSQYGEGIKGPDDVKDFKNGKVITRSRCYFDQASNLSVGLELVSTSPREEEFVLRMIEISSGRQCAPNAPARPFPPLRLKFAVGIGSSEAEVLRGCGKPREILGNAEGRSLLYDPGLIFELSHDTVTLIRFIGRFPAVSSAGVCNPAANGEVEKLLGRKVIQVIATQTHYPNDPNGPSCTYDTGGPTVTVHALRYEYPELATHFTTRERLLRHEDVLAVTEEPGLGEQAFWVKRSSGSGYYVVLTGNLQLTVQAWGVFKSPRDYRQRLRTIAKQALERQR